MLRVCDVDVEKAGAVRSSDDSDQATVDAPANSGGFALVQRISGDNRNLVGDRLIEDSRQPHSCIDPTCELVADSGPTMSTPKYRLSN